MALLQEVAFAGEQSDGLQIGNQGQHELGAQQAFEVALACVCVQEAVVVVEVCSTLALLSVLEGGVFCKASPATERQMLKAMRRIRFFMIK